ncbi:MAG: hypothetical protein ABR498_08025 [Candidatus Dormibacteria bacterium]
MEGSSRGWMLYGSRLVVLATAVVAALITATTVRAYDPPGVTNRVSVASDGSEANGVFGFSSDFPWVSADGRYSAFYSIASNLTAGASATTAQAYEHDAVTGQTLPVSVASDGKLGDKASFASSISDDGRYVAFESDADNLVVNDHNQGGADGNSEGRDAFVHDRLTGTTTRVSVATDGSEGNESSYDPNISADGRYVAFFSDATNLVANDTNGFPDCFLRDMATGATTLVSLASDGSQGNAGSGYCKVTPGGGKVVFTSAATNMIPGTTVSHYAVYVHDIATGVNTLASVANDGTLANDDSGGGSISADGRTVVFSSTATNLVPSDGNGSNDVFVHDLVTGSTKRASVSSDGVEGNAASDQPKMSSDGRFIEFWSDASNLVADDSNGARDVLIHDVLTGETTRASLSSDNGQGNGSSWLEDISASGRYAVFESNASNLAANDTNAAGDIFERDLGPPVGPFALQVSGGAPTVTVSGRARFGGVTVSSAGDAVGDAVTGGSQAGADITHAGVVYRPEDGTLQLTIDTASMPAEGSPGVVAGFDLHAGGATYEVLAAAPAYAAPSFGLLTCSSTVCSPGPMLTGGYGTQGTSIVVSVPLTALGLVETSAITSIHAFTALGTFAAGASATLDTVDLPDAILPAHTVALGSAATGTALGNVQFGAPVKISNGAFSAPLDVSALGSGAYDVWARACVGAECSTTSVPVQGGQPQTNVPESPFLPLLPVVALIPGSAALIGRTRRFRLRHRADVAEISSPRPPSAA